MAVELAVCKNKEENNRTAGAVRVGEERGSAGPQQENATQGSHQDPTTTPGSTDEDLYEDTSEARPAREITGDPAPSEPPAAPSAPARGEGMPDARTERTEGSVHGVRGSEPHDRAVLLEKGGGKKESGKDTGETIQAGRREDPEKRARSREGVHEWPAEGEARLKHTLLQSKTGTTGATGTRWLRRLRIRGRVEAS